MISNILKGKSQYKIALHFTLLDWSEQDQFCDKSIIVIQYYMKTS